MAKANRSEQYQWMFNEISYPFDVMADIFERQGSNKELEGEKKDEYLDLQEALVKEFWHMVETGLTERQQEILKMSAQGMTQTEIAKKLNVNQSSITKSINGNCDYRHGKRSYGGCVKKIKKLAEDNDEIKAIFKRIAELWEDE